MINTDDLTTMCALDLNEASAQKWVNQHGYGPGLGDLLMEAWNKKTTKEEKPVVVKKEKIKNKGLFN